MAVQGLSSGVRWMLLEKAEGFYASGNNRSAWDVLRAMSLKVIPIV